MRRPFGLPSSGGRPPASRRLAVFFLLLLAVARADARAVRKAGEVQANGRTAQRVLKPDAASASVSPEALPPTDPSGAASGGALEAARVPQPTSGTALRQQAWGLTEAATLLSQKASVLKLAGLRASNVASLVFGVLFVVVAIVMQWFNEERTARMEALLSCGLEEAQTVDARKISKANNGRLVHVQGRATAAVQVRDHQFREAVVSGCLKLQSTVEVYAWVQKTRRSAGDEDHRNAVEFVREWCTIHHDSHRFRKPSPENPRPHFSVELGTFTQTCARIDLGAFVLPPEMVSTFQKFEPAMKYMPQRLFCQGLQFSANTKDGYYYARPGQVASSRSSMWSDLPSQLQVGDLRARFLCVPETDVTVVAAQCLRDGYDTFVPYRPMPHGPCTETWQVRQQLVDAGDKSLRGEAVCCTGGVAGVFCCACNTIGRICSSEVVTEEICWISDRFDPIEAPFREVVRRSPWRVWNFRLLGLAVMFLGVRLGLSPVDAVVAKAPVLAVFGGAAMVVLALTFTLATSALVAAAAAVCYRPGMALRWVVAAGLIAAAPLLLGHAAR